MSVITSPLRHAYASKHLISSGAVGLVLVLALALPSQKAHARPEMVGQGADARFAAMDTDKNGSVSREEFFAAQPNMKEGAFVALDTDGDGAISLPEWLVFASGHGKPDEHPTEQHPEGGQTEAAPSPNKAPELIMPPVKQ